MLTQDAIAKIIENGKFILKNPDSLDNKEIENRVEQLKIAAEQGSGEAAFLLFLLYMPDSRKNDRTDTDDAMDFIWDLYQTVLYSSPIAPNKELMQNYFYLAEKLGNIDASLVYVIQLSNAGPSFFEIESDAKQFHIEVKILESQIKSQHNNFLLPKKYIGLLIEIINFFCFSLEETKIDLEIAELLDEKNKDNIKDNIQIISAYANKGSPKALKMLIEFYESYPNQNEELARLYQEKLQVVAQEAAECFLRH